MTSATATAPAHERRLALGRYEPIRRLGSGGFGTVWLARDLKLDRLVALKRIPVSGAELAERARRESLAAARLQHPSIVSLYESAADDDAFYLVSEHVRGATLAELEREGALSDLDVLEIGIALCDALSHAHRRGVVHRDVKPQNVLIPDTAGPDGRTLAKLTDFGVALLAGDEALTATGDVVGTLAYMAPEQAEGREATAASDLYALALCLYEALSGVNPVRARGAAATVRRVGRRLPPLGRLRRDLPIELCEAIDAAVGPHATDRGSIGDLRAALGSAIEAVADEPGHVGGAPLHAIGLGAPRPALSLRERAIAGAGGALLGYFALANLPPDPPVDPQLGALGVAALAALLPRVGWALAALATCAWLALAGSPGAALVVLAAALPVPLVLWGQAWAWSAPALAPVLGVGGIACLSTALAGQAQTWRLRAGLGAAGAWWTLMAQPLLGRELLSGAGMPREADWHASVTDAAGQALGPIVTSPGIAICGVWALAALLLPWVVRGRSLALDFVTATTWAATTAAATAALAGPAAPGVVAGALLAGAAALGFQWVRASTSHGPLT